MMDNYVKDNADNICLGQGKSSYTNVGLPQVLIGQLTSVNVKKHGISFIKICLTTNNWLQLTGLNVTPSVGGLQSKP